MKKNMKYSILARNGEDEYTCDVIIVDEKLKEFYSGLKIYSNKGRKFSHEPINKIELELNKIGSSYEVSLSMPNILSMNQEVLMRDGNLKINLSTSTKTKFHKLNGDLERILGIFNWPGEEHLDIQTLGEILVQKGYLTIK